MNEIRTVLVGSKHVPGGVEAVRALNKGDVLTLRREPNNPVDRNAVACYLGETRLGFIPMKVNRGCAAALDAGIAVSCEVTLEAIVQEFRGTLDVRDAPHLWLRWADG